ncbi:aladin-like [Anopheles aquasalis]|uniref:aladin-like n=1 Tax=Anopheles aquasalis TaxID=42839 RepID=UPI00215AF27D|nr:aladin-like [Anopheles aquasalis]
MCAVQNLQNFPSNIPPSPLRLHYPELNLSRELPHHHPAGQHARDDCTRDVMVPVAEPLSKRIMSILIELGPVEALREATGSNSKLVSSTARYLLTFGDRIGKLFLSYPCQTSLELVAKHSQTRNWSKSAIRGLCWHPTTFKLAVATVDDSVRLFTTNTQVTLLLKNGLQKGITCMAWRPFTSGELAIGCLNGVLLWSVDPNSLIARPLTPPTQLVHGKHRPVTSVSWTKDGQQLITASVADGTVVVWKVDQQRVSVTHRVGMPCAFASWSPNSSHLLVTTIGKAFYLCNVQSRLQRRPWMSWDTPHGSIQSFAWSRDDRHILFVTTGDKLLFYSPVATREGLDATNNRAFQLIDLTETTTDDGSEIGGLPQAIVWCPLDRYLAISFKHSPTIAVFFTALRGQQFSVEPYCFLSGGSMEYPACIAFQENFQAESIASAQSVLTIGWSSGRIEYCPLK